MQPVRIKGRAIRVGDTVLVGDRWERVDAIEEGLDNDLRYLAFAAGYRRPVRASREYDVLPRAADA